MPDTRCLGGIHCGVSSSRKRCTSGICCQSRYKDEIRHVFGLNVCNCRSKTSALHYLLLLFLLHSWTLVSNPEILVSLRQSFSRVGLRGSFVILFHMGKTSALLLLFPLAFLCLPDACSYLQDPRDPADTMLASEFTTELVHRNVTKDNFMLEVSGCLPTKHKNGKH